jgi:hypothetical protein
VCCLGHGAVSSVLVTNDGAMGGGRAPHDAWHGGGSRFDAGAGRELTRVCRRVDGRAASDRQ